MARFSQARATAGNDYRAAAIVDQCIELWTGMLAADAVHDETIVQNVTVLRTELLASIQDLSHRLKSVRALLAASTAPPPGRPAVEEAAAIEPLRSEAERLRRLLEAEQAASALLLRRADAHAAEIDRLRAFSAGSVADLLARADAAAAAADRASASAAARRQQQQQQQAKPTPPPPQSPKARERAAAPGRELAEEDSDRIGNLHFIWPGRVVYVV